MLANASTADWSTTRRRWGVVVLMGALFIQALDLTILTMAMPAMALGLQASPTQTLWMMDIYAFMIAGFLITMGSLGDRFGSRRVLELGLLGFGISSAVAAFAPNPEVMIIARAVQGASSACLMPSTLTLLRRLYPRPSELARVLGIWVSVYSLGAAAGPILGGIILEHFWWGAVFLINIPVVIVALIGGRFALPKDGNLHKSVPMDLPGAALTTGALLLLVYGVKELALVSLSVVAVVAILLGAALMWAAIRHLRRAPHPMIDLSFASQPRIFTALALNGSSMFAFAGGLLILAPYLQTVGGLGPFKAGLVLFPGLVAGVVGALYGGKLVSLRSPRTIAAECVGGAVLGCVVIAVAMVMSFQQPGSQPTTGMLVMVAVGWTIASLSLAAIDPMTNAIVVGAADDSKVGAASGLSESGYEIGGALGMAVLGGIALRGYQLLVPGNLEGTNYDASEGAIRNSVQSAQAFAESHNAPEVATAAYDAFATSVLAAVVTTATLLAVYGVMSRKHLATTPLAGDH